jgi:hypothetical protein
MGVKYQKGRSSRVGLAGIMLLTLNSCAGMSRADNERFEVAVTKNVCNRPVWAAWPVELAVPMMS